MVPSIFTSILALAALVAAAPATTPSDASVTLKNAGIISRNTTKQYETIPVNNSNEKTVVQPDEVLLYGNGRTQVVKQSVYAQMLQEGAIYNLNASTPEEKIFNKTFTPEEQTSPIHARCTWYKSVQIQSTETFNDWDVQMSRPIKGDPSGRTLVSIAEGFSVSNAVSVTASATYTLIKDVLESSLQISYTRTWGSSYTASYTFGVTAGKYSVVVSNPVVTRRSGRLLEGCVGSMTTTSTFYADEHHSASFNGLNWVEGAISTCESWDTPVPRCLGQGTMG